MGARHLNSNRSSAARSSILGEAKGLDPILPTEKVLTGEQVNRHRKYFSRPSFRKLLRRLTSGGATGTTLDELQKIAGAKAPEYLQHLEDVGAIARTGSTVALTRHVHDIGPSLEWYVADLLQCEYDAAAAWGVKIEDLSAGGDFDVLAVVNSSLLYVETKSSHPSNIDESQLRNVLQRNEELNPDLTILLIDTESDLRDLHDRLFAIMLPILRSASRVPDEEVWPPDGQFIKPLNDVPGVSYGYGHVYITGTKYAIDTQIGRCLRHYQTRVKGLPMWTLGFPLNWLKASDPSR